MRVAILARGPSIWRTWGEARHANYSVVMAINGAIRVFQADYLVSADPANLRILTGMPRIGYIWRSKMLQPGEAAPEPYYDLPMIDADTDAPPAPYRQAFSVETAIHVAAAMFGAERIELFGADMNGPDPKAISNEACGERVDNDRWKLEREHLARAMASYPGAEVIRHA